MHLTHSMHDRPAQQQKSGLLAAGHLGWRRVAFSAVVLGTTRCARFSLFSCLPRAVRGSLATSTTPPPGRAACPQHVSPGPRIHTRRAASGSSARRLRPARSPLVYDRGHSRDVTPAGHTRSRRRAPCPLHRARRTALVGRPGTWRLRVRACTSHERRGCVQGTGRVVRAVYVRDSQRATRPCSRSRRCPRRAAQDVFIHDPMCCAAIAVQGACRAWGSAADRLMPARQIILCLHKVRPPRRRTPGASAQFRQLRRIAARTCPICGAPSARIPRAQRC